MNTIIHCENCGSDWVDNGINAGCACKRIADLEEECEKANASLAKVAPVIEELERQLAELEADRDKWEQEAGEQHARALAFQKQQQRLKWVISNHLSAIRCYGPTSMVSFETFNAMGKALAKAEKDDE